jgi:hypothetical protein
MSKASSHTLHSLVKEELAHLPPCLILLTDFDQIIQKDNSTNPDSGNESLEQLFQFHFSQLLNDFNPSHEKNKPTQPVFMIITKHYLELKSSLKSLFSVVIEGDQEKMTPLTEVLSKEFSVENSKEIASALDPLEHSKQIYEYHGLLQDIMGSSLREPNVKSNNSAFFLPLKHLAESLKKIILSSNQLTFGEERFSSSSTKIAPVHWEDIGGLE